MAKCLMISDALPPWFCGLYGTVLYQGGQVVDVVLRPRDMRDGRSVLGLDLLVV